MGHSKTDARSWLVRGLVATTALLGAIVPGTAEEAQTHVGQRVRVTALSQGVGASHEDEVVGVLKSIDPDGLTVLADETVEPVKVPAANLRRLEISHGRQRPGWAIPSLVAGGALAGALTGGLVGGYSQCDPGYGCDSDEEVESSARTGAWIGAAAGGLGGLIGALFIRQERWEQAVLPAWARERKVSLGLVRVRRGFGLRVSVAF